jgi:hypothetical protein
MTKARYFVAASAIAAAVLFPATPSHANPALEFASSPTYNVGSIPGGVSAGWSFKTNAAVTVVALDAFNPTYSGLVTLYNTLGVIIAQTTVTNSDPIEGFPWFFHAHAISPVTLSGNTTYFIVQDNPQTPDAQGYIESIGLTTDPLISYLSPVIAIGTGNLPMTDALGGTYAPGYFAPNLDIQAAPVPEPVSIAVLGAGLAGLGVIRRKRAI